MPPTDTAISSNRQSGAAMVELAVILPIFVLLLFGMIEASWAFAQSNDVRHGAREGARLAAVDFGDVATIGAEVCDRMDVTGGGVTVTLSPGSSPADPGDRGSTGRIQVTVVYSSITGAVDQFFDGKTLSSDIDFILEQPLTGEAQWWNTGSGGTFTCTS